MPSWQLPKSQELGIQPGELPTAKALQGLVERYHVQPDHVVPLAMWSWKKDEAAMAAHGWWMRFEIDKHDGRRMGETKRNEKNFFSKKNLGCV